MWIYYLCGGCGVTVGRIETRVPVDDGIPIEMDDGAIAADLILGHCRRCRPVRLLDELEHAPEANALGLA